MEITWYGQTCMRLKGREAVVVADAYQSIVGPTGRGITADIATYSHPDDAPLPKAKGRRSRDGRTILPTSLESAFTVDGPGEYEVKNVLLTGVRTYRDDSRGATKGKGVSFAVEIDGVHTIHLGDIGHLLSCNHDGTFVEGFDPGLRLDRAQTIMAGAPCCTFRYRMGGPED